jgi:hypothetical protein
MGTTGRGEEKPTTDVLRACAVRNIFETGFLKDDQSVNALILTHADKDHCNQLVDIFNHKLKAVPPIPKVTKIDALYHSMALDRYSQGGARQVTWRLTSLSHVTPLPLIKTSKA